MPVRAHTLLQTFFFLKKNYFLLHSTWFSSYPLTQSLMIILINSAILAYTWIWSSVLRAAAAAVKHEDDRRLFHNAALRKRRKEVGDNRVSFNLSHFAAACPSKLLSRVHCLKISGKRYYLNLVLTFMQWHDN